MARAKNTASARRTPQEQKVWDLFLSGAYQASGCCRNPTCTTPTTALFTVGRHPDARICVVCFEFVFKLKFPTRRGLGVTH